MSGGRSAQPTNARRRPRAAVVMVMLTVSAWVASSAVPAGAATKRTSTTAAPTSSAAGAVGSGKGATSTVRPAATTTVKPRPTTSTIAAKDVKTDVEHKIIDAQTEAAPDLKIGKATCPKALAVPKTKIPVGTFTCTIVIEGVLAPYEVVLTAGGGFQKSGTYQISPAKAIIDTEKIVAFVRSSLDEPERTDAIVTCGRARVVVLDPGKTLGCSITNGTDVQKVSFLVKDKAGTVALQP